MFKKKICPVISIIFYLCDVWCFAKFASLTKDFQTGTIKLHCLVYWFSSLLLHCGLFTDWLQDYTTRQRPATSWCWSTWRQRSLWAWWAWRTNRWRAAWSRGCFTSWLVRWLIPPVFISRWGIAEAEIKFAPEENPQQIQGFLFSVGGGGGGWRVVSLLVFEDWVCRFDDSFPACGFLS